MQPGTLETTCDRRRALKTCLVLLGSGLTGGAALAQAPAGAAALGVVEEVRGDVQAEREGKRRALAAKGEVFAGDTLLTGDSALAVLKLGPQTTIKLGAQARLKIERYLADAGGVFDMQAGHMMFERKGRPAREGISFRSAYGLIAIRGTRFYAGPNRGGFAVLVGEGRVEVTGGGRAVVLGPQQGTDIKVAGQSPSPAARWQLARIREMLANFK